MIMIVVMRVDGSTVVAETEVVCDCFHAQLSKDVKTNKLSDRFLLSRCSFLGDGIRNPLPGFNILAPTW